MTAGVSYPLPGEHVHRTVRRVEQSAHSEEGGEKNAENQSEEAFPGLACGVTGEYILSQLQTGPYNGLGTITIYNYFGVLMKKLFGLLLLFVLVASIATAQTTGPGKEKWTIGPSVGLELPIGDYGDVAGFGIGATARAQYGLQENLALTGDFGYTWHGKKNEFSTSALPLMFGVKYAVGKSFYVSGQLGLYFVTVDVPDVVIPGFGTYSVDASNSETKFALAPGVGYEKGPWEAYFRFVVLDTDIMNLGLTVAYNFPMAW